MLVLDLARGDYVARRENVILLGPSGVGKTHIAIALGLAACQKNPGVEHQADIRPQPRMSRARARL